MPDAVTVAAVPTLPPSRLLVEDLGGTSIFEVDIFVVAADGLPATGTSFADDDAVGFIGGGFPAIDEDAVVVVVVEGAAAFLVAAAALPAPTPPAPDGVLAAAAAAAATAALTLGAGAPPPPPPLALPPVALGLLLSVMVLACYNVVCRVLRVQSARFEVRCVHRSGSDTFCVRSSIATTFESLGSPVHQRESLSCRLVVVRNYTQLTENRRRQG